ncbi:hypothetical protein KSD_52340 [Ktedonobacter sp. SOSP1-85]|uniref:CRISPR system precrRNA processing endoribonuclease RAMP protein Cas6 n=1 Tax=Ktedonobacter sp. SOSP1-85 TaxID=2778367 RepID=UPI0019154636|nr:CRISPR system precrRNA processing endoribonuclease RAMP protein Cas6 [Ktedonobacter sp. SOSP1-85]GHO77463.1 hypothetical protein KSD_52340 [Ktedonobacter sp. SOSP1-85]
MQPILRSATLTTTHLRFLVRAQTPLELDAHSGSSIRGSFFHAILDQFCTNKSAPSCSVCILNEACPVSAIAAPLREDNTWGQDIPRPFVITPPLGGIKRYQPGEYFSFSMTLIGSIVKLLPYIMLSIKQIEREGLGRRLDENRGQRGLLRVERVEAYHPFTQEQQIIYEAGNVRVNAPVVSVKPEDYKQRAESLDKRRVTLRFITPTRLIDQEHLVQRASFRPLVRRLLERVIALEKHYGSQDLSLSKEERDTVAQLADQVTCSADHTHWEELSSYSNRQKRSTPTSGLMGVATFEGQLEPFLELLALGELLHIGKNVVKGNGWYQLTN